MEARGDDEYVAVDQNVNANACPLESRDERSNGILSFNMLYFIYS